MSPVPDRYAVTLDQIEQDQDNRIALATARLYVEQFHPRTYREIRPDQMWRPSTMVEVPGSQPERGMILFGTVGTGKSTILGAIATELSEKGASVAWASWPMMIDDLGNPVGHRGVMEQLGSVQALFLDELGQATPPEFLKTRCLALIGARYDAKLPIFGCTNLKEKDLELRLGSGIVSRLREACDFEILSGLDRRLGKPRLLQRKPNTHITTGGDTVWPDDPTAKAMRSALGDKFAGRITQVQLVDKVTGLAKEAGWPVRP